MHPALSAHLLRGRPRATAGFVQQSRHILVLVRMLLFCLYLLGQQLLLPLLLFLPGYVVRHKPWCGKGQWPWQLDVALR